MWRGGGGLLSVEKCSIFVKWFHGCRPLNQIKMIKLDVECTVYGFGRSRLDVFEVFNKIKRFILHSFDLSDTEWMEFQFWSWCSKQCIAPFYTIIDKSMQRRHSPTRMPHTGYVWFECETLTRIIVIAILKISDFIVAHRRVYCVFTPIINIFGLRSWQSSLQKT